MIKPPDKKLSIAASHVRKLKTWLRSVPFPDPDDFNDSPF